MSELRLLHEATVGKDEIDHLGHMNVRFYQEKASRATQLLAREHGLSPEACRELGAVLELRDTFTRHYREQLAGAELVVMGGVIEVKSDALRFYHELRNPSKDERAATFVHEVTLRKIETRAALPLPEMLAQSAGNARVEWPEHGHPRTLDLDRVPATISLSEARSRGLAMRKERQILESECDARGFFQASNYLELVWGGEPLEARSEWLPLYDLEGGGQFGWATLESRGVLRELPCVGSRVQSFGAEVEIAGKTSTRHHWVFDVDSAELLFTSSIVNLAFDIGRRRAIEIPPPVRELLERQYHPDLR